MAGGTLGEFEVVILLAVLHRLPRPTAAPCARRSPRRSGRVPGPRGGLRDARSAGAEGLPALVARRVRHADRGGRPRRFYQRQPPRAGGPPHLARARVEHAREGLEAFLDAIMTAPRRFHGRWSRCWSASYRRRAAPRCWATCAEDYAPRGEGGSVGARAWLCARSDVACGGVDPVRLRGRPVPRLAASWCATSDVVARRSPGARSPAPASAGDARRRARLRGLSGALGHALLERPVSDTQRPPGPAPGCRRALRPASSRGSPRSSWSASRPISTTRRRSARSASSPRWLPLERDSPADAGRNRQPLGHADVIGMTMQIGDGR